MPQDQLRQAIDALRVRLQDELEAQLTSLTERQDHAIQDARRGAEADADQRWVAKTDTLRAEWAARLESEVAAARAEGDTRVVAEVARLRAEAEQAAAAAAAQARIQAQQAAAQADAHARAEAEKAAGEALARVRAEAERTAAQVAVQLRAEAEETAARVAAEVRAEAEQAAAQLIAQLRAEIQQATHVGIRIREEAEHEIESERQRGIAVLDAERERWTAELDAERQRAAAAVDAERQRVEAERQMERQRYEAERVAERQRFDAERQQYRSERLRFEAERQQFVIERDRLEAQLTDTTSVQSAAADVEADLQRLEVELAAERRQLQEVNDALRDANDSLRRVEAALVQEREARAEEAVTRSQAAAAAASMAELRIAERESQLAAVERLFGAMRAMDRADSLTKILATLVDAAGAEAPRAALFVINGDRLQGLQAVGFTGASIEAQALPMDGSSLLSHAVTRGEAMTNSIDPAVQAPAFAALPEGRAAIAVPIAIGGDTVAVLYADDGRRADSAVAPSWLEAIQILGSHAASCLAHPTATRTGQALRLAGSEAPDAHTSAKRYARLLVSEIKLYNEAAVRAGRDHRDLLDRLQPEIDRARRLYEERVPAVAGPLQGYFYQELVQTLADGDAALLGEPA